MPRYHQGIYKPKNPRKYKGDPTNIVYRSGWEKMALLWLDTHPACIEFSSEELVIPYVSPKDGKAHRYFVDLVATFRYKDNSVKTFVIEIKPASQAVAPNKGNKTEKKFLQEALTYEINQAKWEAAKKFCDGRGWRFIVMDEYDLGLKKRSSK